MISAAQYLLLVIAACLAGPTMASSADLVLICNQVATSKGKPIPAEYREKLEFFFATNEYNRYFDEGSGFSFVRRSQYAQLTKDKIYITPDNTVTIDRRTGDFFQQASPGTAE